MAWQTLSRAPLQDRKRAIVKTLCYRFCMLLITVVVAWTVVGDFGAALNIGLIANVMKTATYYVYERAWDHVKWGLTLSP